MTQSSVPSSTQTFVAIDVAKQDAGVQNGVLNSSSAARRRLAAESGIDGDHDRDRRLARGRQGVRRRAEDTREYRGDRGEDKDVEKTSPVMAHAPAAQYRCGVSRATRSRAPPGRVELDVSP